MKWFFYLLFILTTATYVAAQSGGGVIDWRYNLQHPLLKSRAAKARNATDFRKEGRDYLNTLRSGSGMIEFAPNSLLDTAAQHHVNYLLCANQFGHGENENDCPDEYTGAWPFDRITAAGYNPTATGEDITAGSDTMQHAIDGLMSAIYHRFGFLTFKLNEIGIGYGGDSNYRYGTVYNFDMGNQGTVTDTEQRNPYVVLWPYNNFKNAQTSFDNSENPVPLPECRHYGIAGNPISVAFNERKSGSLSLDSFELYNADNQKMTDVKVLDHTNDDHLDLREYVLFPMTSLELDSRYKAVFKYTEAGTEKTLVWQFHTRRYDYKRYNVTDGNTYDLIAGQTYILHIKPADCTIPLNTFSYRYSGGKPDFERLGLDIMKIKISGDTTFSFPNSSSPQVTFTLHAAATDNAIAPSSPDPDPAPAPGSGPHAAKILPAVQLLLHQ